MARPKKKRVGKKERRISQEPVVRELARFFVDGRPTVFAETSAARHGLRAAMCLDGVAWAAAEKRADLIVRLALARIGARYPSWSVGQRHDELRSYTWCQECHGRFDEESTSPWCSRECSDAYWSRATRRIDAAEIEAHAIARRLWRANGAAIYVPSERQRTCQHCGGLYVPGKRHTRFCSLTCSHAHHRGAARPCLWCSAEFVPVTATQLYCSRPCAKRASNRKRRDWWGTYDRTCVVCGSAFQTRHPLVVTCSEACRAEAKLAHRRARRREAAAAGVRAPF